MRALAIDKVCSAGSSCIREWQTCLASTTKRDTVLAQPKRNVVIFLNDSCVGFLQLGVFRGVSVEQFRPSQVVQLLRQYELPMLILIAVQSSRAIRHQIWQYLTVWSRVLPLLNGNDLRKLGYKPGPQYKLMLDDILAATLDGVTSDRTSAQEFLAKHYPI